MDALRGEANATAAPRASRRAPSAPARRRSRRGRRVAGFCYCAADRRSAAGAGGLPEARRAARRADGAARRGAAARLALDLEPRRVVAARFGMMVASEVGDADAAGAFGRAFARLKWPPSGLVDHVLGSAAVDVPVMIAPPVAWSPTLEEVSSTVLLGHVHSTFVDRLAEQLQFLDDEGLANASCALPVDLRVAAAGLRLLGDAARRLRVAAHGDASDEAAYAYVDRSGEIHAPVSRLLAGEPDDQKRRTMAAGAAVLGKAVCVVDAPAVAGGALALSGEAAAAAEAALDRGVAVVDGLLRAETLERLRRFVLRSTVFTRAYAQGYLGAFLGDGFGGGRCIRSRPTSARFPRCSATPSSRRPGPTSTRATPTAAASTSTATTRTCPSTSGSRATTRTSPGSKLGGLRIFEREPPADWDFAKANQETDAILALLGDDAVEVVAHRFNRAVILNGHRFHQTDAMDFRPGFRNNRINLTFLFRRRTLEASCHV
ncbi:hypothetical protein JL722_4333 [Aureococcus anophagefferens]|nr:hypothetical protein JL722_4333 [Aureococcus anophagefferens]